MGLAERQYAPELYQAPAADRSTDEPSHCMASAHASQRHPKVALFGVGSLLHSKELTVWRIANVMVCQPRIIPTVVTQPIPSFIRQREFNRSIRPSIVCATCGRVSMDAILQHCDPTLFIQYWRYTASGFVLPGSPTRCTVLLHTRDRRIRTGSSVVKESQLGLSGSGLVGNISVPAAASDRLGIDTAIDLPAVLSERGALNFPPIRSGEVNLKHSCAFGPEIRTW